MKKIIYLSFFVVMVCVSSSVSVPVKAQGTDLFFSEYVEGTSNNKALEIYNPTDSAIDLSGYKIQSFINGSGTLSAFATSSATINAKKTYVICNSNASAPVLAVCNQQVAGVGTLMTFNGDDAIALAKTDGTILDVIGQIGIDPGTEWGTGLTGTADNTLSRKCNIENGDPIGTDIFDPSIQWDGYATDTFSDLGQYACFASPTETPTLDPTSTPTVLPTELPVPTPTEAPTEEPSVTPTPIPFIEPTETPTEEPQSTPSASPTLIPTPTVSASPTLLPTATPKNNDEDKHHKHWVREIYQKCSKFVRESIERIHKIKDEDDHHNFKKEKENYKWPSIKIDDHFRRK